jgi:hypothetical protein
VVLINSILGEIPIFYVSLFKLTTMVWKLLLRIQRVGLKGRGGINWVSWEEVCKPKDRGGCCERSKTFEQGSSCKVEIAYC